MIPVIREKDTFKDEKLRCGVYRGEKVLNELKRRTFTGTSVHAIFQIFVHDHYVAKLGKKHKSGWRTMKFPLTIVY